jgi:hypothetical protein
MDSITDFVQRQWELARGITHPSANGTRWIAVLGFLGVVGFILSAVVLSLALTNKKEVDAIVDFSERILTDYLTNKCVQCYPMENLTYALNESLTGFPGDVRMELRDGALEEDQFVTGLRTPCDTCQDSVGFQWSVDVSAFEVNGFGIYGEKGASIIGAPYSISQYGLSYDPLKIWTLATGIAMDHTISRDRCRPSVANSMYIVAISSDIIQEVCCQYVICMCVQPGPQEWCTRPLLSASNPLNEDRMNCLNGTMTDGCGCGLDVC